MLKEKFTFLTSEKTVGATSAYTVVNPNPLTKMYVSLVQTSAGSSVVSFEGRLNNTYINISSKNMATGTSASMVSGTLSDVWEIPISAFDAVRLNVTLSSGSLTAIGRVVD